MLSQEDISKVFEYYEVPSEVDSIFGDWAVSKGGDVINIENRYPIYTKQVESTGIDEWVEHLAEKTWFNTNVENDFRNSYERAEEILQITR